MQNKTEQVIEEFKNSYLKAAAHDLDQLPLAQELFNQLTIFVAKQLHTPASFEVFHQSERKPFDFYQFGLDFIRPLIDFEHSAVNGIEQVKQIRAQLDRKENVILFANHQTEPDPQIISLLIEPLDKQLASQMIFIAGHRVISDPLAIPFSLGRNLLCIYSKKHIQHPPEDKEKKIAHNQRTIKQMSELLNQGGCCIYVAPSGGRDRLKPDGLIEVAPFDAQSIELFWLIGQQAKQLTHFYPLALQTYHVMPPPQAVEKELGEKRIAGYSPVYLSFGQELDMQSLPAENLLDKKLKRLKRAELIHSLVQTAYKKFPSH